MFANSTSIRMMAYVILGTLIGNLLQEREVPPIPEGCTGDRWAVAYSWFPVTGEGHRRSPYRTWSEFFEGIETVDEYNVVYHSWFEQISPDSVVYNIAVGEELSQRLFVRLAPYCLFMGEAIELDGHMYHGELVSPDIKERKDGNETGEASAADTTQGPPGHRNDPRWR